MNQSQLITKIITTHQPILHWVSKVCHECITTCAFLHGALIVLDEYQCDFLNHVKVPVSNVFIFINYGVTVLHTEKAFSFTGQNSLISREIQEYTSLRMPHIRNVSGDVREDLIRNRSWYRIFSGCSSVTDP